MSDIGRAIKGLANFIIVGFVVLLIASAFIQSPIDAIGGILLYVGVIIGVYIVIRIGILIIAFIFSLFFR